MATLEQIGAALKAAAAAGDTAAATKLAAAYKAMQAQGGAVSPGPRAQQQNAPGQPEQPGAFGNNPMAQSQEGGNPLPPASFDDNVRAFGANIDQLPIVGPAALGGLEKLRGMVQGMTPEQVAAETARARTMAPSADTAGKLFYNVAPYAIGGALAPKLFGMGEAVPWSAGLKPVVSDIAGRTAAAGLSNLAIGTGDSMARGSDPLTAVQQNLVPSAAIAALPGLGALMRGGSKLAGIGANWATGGLAPSIKAAWNPEGAAQKLVGRANMADQSAKSVMTPAEEALATQNGLDISNLDRGGPATASLARVAKSSSGAAETTLTNAVTHGPPGLDAANFLTKLVGGSADDLALRQGLRDTARIVNDPAYKKAYSAPAAASIFTPHIQQLLGAPELQAAIKEAEGIGKTRAARTGGTPPAAPFKFDAEGRLIATPVSAPTLQFWDNVQQALRRQSERLGPTEKSAFDDVTDLRSQLLANLDAAVPAFKTARQGAAAFFNADNMLEAGKQFANQPRSLPEAMKALSNASPADRKAFEIGYASSKVDLLKSSPDFGVVKQAFNSPAAKELNRAVLGNARADQLESYVKVLTIQNGMKQAVTGGSRTADWLIGGGLLGGGAVAAGTGWDPTKLAAPAAMLVGAARLGHGSIGRMVDKQVLNHVATLLASSDKAALTKVIANATLSPKWRAAIDAIFEGMAATSRGAVAAALPTAAAAAPWPQTDTRDYSNGPPQAISPGPRVSPMP